MESFDVVLQLQGILFLLMIAGIVLRKLNIIDAKGRSYLTDLLIDIILPCNIISAFMIELSREILQATLTVLLIAIAIQIFSWLIGKFIYHNADPPRRKVMQYATMCSNAGFMGNPIAEGIFGPEGLLYASIYLIPLRFFMWTAGISCFTSMKFKEAAGKLAVHPCIIAVWIGFILMGTGIELPYVLTSSIRHLSSCTLPISILIIGTILAEVEPHTLLDRQAIWFCFIRLIVLPLTVLMVCMVLRLEVVVTGVSVVLTCMPAGSTTAILAEKYGGDAAYASKIILMSTVLSLVTIPLWCYIIQLLQ